MHKSTTVYYYDLYMAFDADPTLEVGGVFLDMSIAFAKVWHEGLICKLRQVSISGEATAFLITDSSM